MAYTQLTLAERNDIEIRLQQGDSQNQIAWDMNRSQSTISRELRMRTPMGCYANTSLKRWGCPYVSGYLSPQLKPRNLKGEARGEDAKELFERI
ncbi:helix-turn-helix domain-containing protein [Nitrosomonas communis]|uniref:helix-turn-helix domain-containing protein n=1 Tax=Nitrosomonas communis TaxID=44574 RepID=UPI003D29973B